MAIYDARVNYGRYLDEFVLEMFSSIGPGRQLPKWTIIYLVL